MELDKIKELWNEIDVLKEKQHLSDEKIKDMLKNKGKTALSKLIWFAKFSMVMFIPLGVFGYYYFVGYNNVFAIIYFLICIFGVLFEIYKYRLLKKINFSDMTIKDVSERILKYKNIIKNELIYGITGLVVFLGAYIYVDILQNGAPEHLWVLVIIMTIYVILASLFIGYFIYKRIYFNRINQIKESLNELKEFEN
jgi:MFS family permease